MVDVRRVGVEEDGRLSDVSEGLARVASHAEPAPF